MLLHRGSIGWMPAILLLAASAAAQDTEPVGEEAVDEEEEIVVTATRTETPSGEVGSSVTVVTGEEIERRRRTTVSDVLREVPGLDVSQSGSFGGVTSVFIRGAKSEHTVVLVDGMELGDPMGMGREVDLAHLTVDGIDRIEVVRGPQSTLYGSDAMGGVINIITKRGEGDPACTASLEAGSHGTFRESATAGGESGGLDYSVSVSRLDTDGVSAAGEAYGNTEKDGYENTTFSGNVQFEPSEDAGIDFRLWYTDAVTDLDDSGGAGGDDPDYVGKTRRLVAGTKARFGLMDGLSKHTLGLSVTDHHREYIDPGESESSYDGRMVKLDWQNELALGDAHRLTFGAELEGEKGSSTWQTEEDARLAGLFVQDQLDLGESVFATLGARVDSHSTFGTHATWRATGALVPDGTGAKISATVGTGFKAPSLYQLYSSSGNVDLEPEESLAWDVGVRQALQDGRASLGITYFDSDCENLILWEWTGPGPFDGQYQNVQAAESRGVEIEAVFRPSREISILASYTYTDSEEGGAVSLKRPWNKAGVRVSRRFLEKGDVSLSVRHVGDRKDFGGAALDAFTLVDLAASCDISDAFRVFGRIENLLDEEYEETSGYGTPGVSAYVGVKARF